MNRVEVLDLEFQGLSGAIAAFLLSGPEGPVLVETGPASTYPVLERRLAAHGVRPQDLRHVLVTHIHLDHSGAAGWLARHGARIYVHQLGAPHLIDPGKLLASATRIYGERMDTLWGQTLPVPAEQVTALSGGERLRLAGLELTALDTPGHARHHLAYLLERVAFTGDVVGVRMQGRDFVSLPAPPPEFDREAWKLSLTRLRLERLERLYLTHFGACDAVEAQLAEVERLLGLCVDYLEIRREQPRDILVADYVQWNRQRALASGLDPAEWSVYELANPLDMSVDGILRYLSRRVSPPGLTGKEKRAVRSRPSSRE